MILWKWERMISPMKGNSLKHLSALIIIEMTKNTESEQSFYDQMFKWKSKLSHTKSVINGLIKARKKTI